METKNIMIVGVGGQGTLLTSRVLGGIIEQAGYDVKLSEVHGMAAIVYIFAPQFVTLFRKDDPDVIAVGTTALRYSVFAFPLSAWVVMCNMMLQSIGKGVKASIVSSARQGIFFLPLIMVLPRFLGLTGVEVCQAISDVCAFLLSIPIGMSVIREMGAADE